MTLKGLLANWPADIKSAVGCGLSIGFCALISMGFSLILGHGDIYPWLVGSMGASAAIVFCLPQSPLARPYKVIVGNMVSALAALLAMLLISDPYGAGALAVGLAVLFMHLSRSLHPPGGGLALLACLGHLTQFGFILFPVLINSLCLVLFAMAYHHLTGLDYPWRPQT